VGHATSNSGYCSTTLKAVEGNGVARWKELTRLGSGSVKVHRSGSPSGQSFFNLNAGSLNDESSPITAAT